MGLLIQDGVVVNADRTMAADVLIEGATIREVRAGIDPQGHTVVDAAGLLVLPGGIDQLSKGRQRRDAAEHHCQARRRCQTGQGGHPPMESRKRLDRSFAGAVQVLWDLDTVQHPQPGFRVLCDRRTASTRNQRRLLDRRTHCLHALRPGELQTLSPRFHSFQELNPGVELFRICQGRNAHADHANLL